MQKKDDFVSSHIAVMDITGAVFDALKKLSTPKGDKK